MAATNQAKVGWAHMLRDVLVASINKGQFPVVVGGLLLLIVAARLPPNDLAIQVDRVGHALEGSPLTGYLIAGVIFFGWMVHSRYQWRTFRAETERLNAEKRSLPKNKKNQ